MSISFNCSLCNCLGDLISTQLEYSSSLRDVTTHRITNGVTSSMCDSNLSQIEGNLVQCLHPPHGNLSKSYPVS